MSLKSEQERRDDSYSRQYRNVVNAIQGTLVPVKEITVPSRDQLLDPKEFHKFASAVEAGDSRAKQLLKSLDDNARKDLSSFHGSGPLTRFLFQKD